MTWRVARCLDRLLSQWDQAHPDRSTASDGSIGDAAHAARTSDHNPWVGPADSDGRMIVTARDFTHDPDHGADAGKLAETLKQRKDPRVKYVIWNRRIWSLARDAEGWRPYTGENPHTHHVHVSCSSIERLYDNTNAWNLTLPGSTGGNTGQQPGEVDHMSAQDVEELKQFIRTEVYAGPRYQALQDGISGIAKGVGAILPYLRAEDVADDAALSQAVAQLKGSIDALAAAATPTTPPTAQ